MSYARETCLKAYLLKGNGNTWELSHESVHKNTPPMNSLKLQLTY